ncbi:hypothetical protein CBR_g39556 [Chara braunii]|uniref:Reverse transcriptase/retrotransposon-derived protein RNase H-like domain-containing protein n=1 Tax=Chara braunii TaxID=69332 RepID=A0A388LS64_CHABU|nr:hypothetical protein CBR_g39556 [Chara braunii]|eukprot:GBG85095.1 hypothetical protein CBR_g39556 [Chara braunii]
MGHLEEESVIRLNHRFQLSNEGNDEQCLASVHPNKPWLLFTRLVPGERSFELWDYEKNVVIAKSPTSSRTGWYAAAFAYDENWVMIWDEPEMQVLDIYSEEVVRHFQLPNIELLRVRPGLPHLLVVKGLVEIQLLDWEGGCLCMDTFISDLEVDVLKFHPREPHIFAAALDDRTINIWDINTRSVVQTLEGHSHHIRYMTFSEDPQKPLLIAGGWNDDVRVWNYKTGACLAVLTGHTGKVRAFTFHPHLPFIFTTDESGNIRLWHESNYELATTYSSQLGSIGTIFPCADSNMIAVGGQGSVALYEVVVPRATLDNIPKKVDNNQGVRVQPKGDEVNVYAGSRSIENLTINQALWISLQEVHKTVRRFRDVVRKVVPPIRRSGDTTYFDPVDPTKQFILITDWQPEAISAIVAQKGNDGREHVIEYASRTVSDERRNDSAPQERREPGPARLFTNSDTLPAVVGLPRGVMGNNNPPSQQPYLDPRGIIGLAFFQPQTASEDEAITLKEEEEEDEEEGDEEEEEETPEGGSYSEHSEEEQSDEEEEKNESEEEEESEWETLGEEAKGAEEDPEAVRKREEIVASKQQLEYASEADLPISNDPARRWGPCCRDFERTGQTATKSIPLPLHLSPSTSSSLYRCGASGFVPGPYPVVPLTT